MSTFFHKFFYIVAVPLVVALAAVVLYMLVLRPMDTDTNLHKAEKKANGEAKEEEPGASISVRRPEISHLVDGRVTWRVFADSIELDTTSGETSLSESSGFFYRDDNDPEKRFEFESPLTLYNEKSKEVESQGRVTGRLMPEMYEMEASGMKWSEKDGALIAEDVILKTDKSLFRGKQLHIKRQEEMVTLTGGFEAEIYVGKRRNR